ncbi:uncharacterized protein HMPREF1541_07626 [Cyphellophora europaea CBS 101466]|uniref:PHD-type domain-containing protein n=1 Tax=Cyphellophora europaea (strain CBS 101466) TaxID=1220924 RepID=W2RQL9_CYPE1|nr:uncharacterized protein HMPREF1541_07626 [Cyphellophora europaea CBS 101466]ETN38003.1 hypothetical protein HMPREF1541_07626 [Cyphellophora europaea CBS 101466]
MPLDTNGVNLSPVPATQQRPAAYASADDGELHSDTIEVQAHAHPHTSEPAISNVDGSIETRSTGSGPPSGVFVKEASEGSRASPWATDWVSMQSDNPAHNALEASPMSRHFSASPALSVQGESHTGPGAVTGKQALGLDEATLQTDSDPDFRHSIPLPAPNRPPPQTFTATSHAPQGYYNTLKMTMPSSEPNGSREPKTSSRRVKQYTLPSGAVVSGKGLGRGRPGIKRGPRQPKSGELSTPGTAPDSASVTPKSAPSGSKKRGRSTSDVGRWESMTPDSLFPDSPESPPEYNPTDETRSGRKIQKPPSVQPQATESASPASKRPKLESRNTAPVTSPALKTHPKIKRRLYRGREQLALCEHCQRGHGPVGNVIVFCDACNKCWHQRCHEPQVPQSVIADSKAEWFCAHCEKILHGKKGKKSKVAMPTSVTTQSQPPQFVGPLVGGAALSQAQKIAFLESRTKEQLISLILSGSDLAPALPMFQIPAPQLPQAQFKSNYTTPVTSLLPFQIVASAEAEDEGYDSYFDEHAALYPKPGNGVKLPPDSADVNILLEHPQSRTFSHWIRGMPTREFSGNSDIVFSRQ